MPAEGTNDPVDVNHSAIRTHEDAAIVVDGRIVMADPPVAYHLQIHVELAKFTKVQPAPAGDGADRQLHVGDGLGPQPDAA